VEEKEEEFLSTKQIKEENQRRKEKIYLSELSSLIADVKEQVLFMQELGVDALAVELPETVSSKPEVQGSKSDVVIRAEVVKSPPPADLSIPKKDVQPKAPGSRLAALPSLAKREKTELIPKIPQTEMPLKSVAVPTPEPAVLHTNDTIESIRAEIGPDCTRCKLSGLGRTKVVNSTGNFNAELMFVGEAPGADEDEQGFPFVGRAGQLLTKIIESIDIKREDVFIGNINRCRPPANRAPEPDETIMCRPFLKREIAVIKPKVIVVLGATAAKNLLETKEPIGKLRGHFHDYLGTKVMPTFHPAYLLRDPHKKREVWEDMKLVREFLNK